MIRWSEKGLWVERCEFISFLSQFETKMLSEIVFLVDHYADVFYNFKILPGFLKDCVPGDIISLNQVENLLNSKCRLVFCNNYRSMSKYRIAFVSLPVRKLSKALSFFMFHWIISPLFWNPKKAQSFWKFYKQCTKAIRYGALTEHSRILGDCDFRLLRVNIEV